MLSPWDQAWSRSGVEGTPGRTALGPDTHSVTYELGDLGQVTARRQFLVLQKGQCRQPAWQGYAVRDKALTHLVVGKSQAGRDSCPLKKLQSLGLAAGLGVSTRALCDSCQPSWAVGGRGPPGGLVPEPAMLAIRRLWVCKLLPAPSAHKGLSPKASVTSKARWGAGKAQEMFGTAPCAG